MEVITSSETSDVQEMVTSVRDTVSASSDVTSEAGEGASVSGPNSVPY
jgi:hypothetical protein